MTRAEAARRPMWQDPVGWSAARVYVALMLGVVEAAEVLSWAEHQLSDPSVLDEHLVWLASRPRNSRIDRDVVADVLLQHVQRLDPTFCLQPSNGGTQIRGEDAVRLFHAGILEALSGQQSSAVATAAESPAEAHAAELLVVQAARLSVGTITPYALCSFVSKAEQLFDYPGWPREFPNLCSWCGPDAERGHFADLVDYATHYVRKAHAAKGWGSFVSKIGVVAATFTVSGRRIVAVERFPETVTIGIGDIVRFAGSGEVRVDGMTLGAGSSTLDLLISPDAVLPEVGEEVRAVGNTTSGS